MYQKNITPKIAGSVENTHFFDGKIWEKHPKNFQNLPLFFVYKIFIHEYSLYIHLHIFTNVEISMFLDGKIWKIWININLTRLCIFDSLSVQGGSHTLACTLTTEYRNKPIGGATVYKKEGGF